MEKLRQPREPELPEGMTFDDLRFVHPQIYPLSVAQLGWEALLGFDIDGNEAKVSYSLRRPVSEDFDAKSLAKRIRLLDEKGEMLPSYRLNVDTKETKTPSLEFNFTGFPTQTTMEVMRALEDDFNPEGSQPRRLQLLGSSEPMDDPYEEEIQPQRKPLFQRAREIFHR